MYKFIISLFLTIAIFTQLPAQEYQTSNGIYCSPQLKNLLISIHKVPEAKQLIESVQKEGPIRIIINNIWLSEEFGAYWDSVNRIIAVAYNPNVAPGKLIGSILFELHNASVDSKIRELDRLAYFGKINRTQYVESMEYLEFINSHNAAKIANKGIKMGIFPKEAFLPTYNTFKEHFHMQKVSGHSSWFAKNYDQMMRS